MGTEFLIAIGVFPVEMLAYQVSMVCAANWPRQLYLYTQNSIHLLFGTTNIKLRFYSVRYFFVQRIFTSPSVNASAAFDLIPLAPFFCKLFASSFQTFPCLVKLFVVDTAQGIFSFLKLFLLGFLLESFCSVFPGCSF